MVSLTAAVCRTNDRPSECCSRPRYTKLPSFKILEPTELIHKALSKTIELDTYSQQSLKTEFWFFIQNQQYESVLACMTYLYSCDYWRFFWLMFLRKFVPLVLFSLNFDDPKLKKDQPFVWRSKKLNEYHSFFTGI